MLSYLRVRGLALLDDVTLELGPGLNVLTGETGAGKSIIVDALSLLRGSRSRSDLIRAGEDSAQVQAQFELNPALLGRIAPILDRHGLPVGETLVIGRVAPRTGRGRITIQGELTTQAVLAEVGESLIDICSQQEHHSLARPARHLELLDEFAQLGQMLQEYRAVYGRWREHQKQLCDHQAWAAERVGQAEYLRFQIEEIERILPQPGEYEALKSRLELLRHAQRWAEFTREAHDLLYEAEDSILTRLAQLEERARRGAAQSARLAAISEHLANACAAVEEADRLVRRLADELEVEPQELERVEERLHQLGVLLRKHGSEQDWSRLVQTMRASLEELEHAEERGAELELLVNQDYQLVLERALALRQARQKAASALGRAVEQELRALHLEQARIEVRFEALAPEQLGPTGLDRAELLFTANPGEPLAPLSRIASGGELSRVLLAFKNVLSTAGAVATYVFDEVDAGVGGRVAIAIAQRLRQAARQSQVLCITHLPQIAAFADSQYRVEKQTRGGRTITRVLRLSPEQRVEELARMLGGTQVTASARAHALELLRQAGGKDAVLAESGARASGSSSGHEPPGVQAREPSRRHQRRPVSRS